MSFQKEFRIMVDLNPNYKTDCAVIGYISFLDNGFIEIEIIDVKDNGSKYKAGQKYYFTQYNLPVLRKID